MDPLATIPTVYPDMVHVLLCSLFFSLSNGELRYPGGKPVGQEVIHYGNRKSGQPPGGIRIKKSISLLPMT